MVGLSRREAEKELRGPILRDTEKRIQLSLSLEPRGENASRQAGPSFLDNQFQSDSNVVGTQHSRGSVRQAENREQRPCTASLLL